MPRLSMILCLTFGLATCVDVGAATLADLELVIDGSADPPGDRLNFTILLTPDEKEIDVQVRGYLVSGARNSRIDPIRAAYSKNRDADGRFLISLKVSRRDKRLAVDTSTVVPYGQLDLPQGKHQIGYEVTGIRDGVVVFVRATPLTIVDITRAPRKEMLLRRKVIRQEKGQVRRAYLPGQKTRGIASKPSEKELEITKSTQVEIER